MAKRKPKTEFDLFREKFKLIFSSFTGRKIDNVYINLLEGKVILTNCPFVGLGATRNGAFCCHVLDVKDKTFFTLLRKYVPCADRDEPIMLSARLVSKALNDAKEPKDVIVYEDTVERFNKFSIYKKKKKANIKTPEDEYLTFCRVNLSTAEVGLIKERIGLFKNIFGGDNAGSKVIYPDTSKFPNAPTAYYELEVKDILDRETNEPIFRDDYIPMRFFLFSGMDMPAWKEYLRRKKSKVGFHMIVPKNSLSFILIVETDNDLAHSISFRTHHLYVPLKVKK